MGLFSPFIYKRKDGKKFWLHMKEKGKVRLYYLSTEPYGAIFNMPSGYEVIENPVTHMPLLKKKVARGLPFGKKKGGETASAA